MLIFSCTLQLQNVYGGDPTFKNIVLDGFEESGGVTKVKVRMTFDGSNDNAQETLQQNLQDGRLGSLAVNQDSLAWNDAYGTYSVCLRACVRACVSACVRACVRAGVRACVRT